MCESTTLPILKVFSSSDLTDPLLGIKCVRVDKHVSGFSWHDWRAFYKLEKWMDGLEIP